MDNATIASITGVIAPWKKRLNKITRTTCNTYAKKLKKKQWYNNRPWAQKRTFWTFEKGIFQVFANFWVTKLKPFSGKERQSVQNYLNQDLIIGSFLKNGIEATWSSITNVLIVWKGHFSVFCKFLSGEGETVFWESETILQKIFR